ncbi:potassium transporter TrkA [Actinomadura spongiicola]|uniref:Potassium transporter TrkA n=1 Tax=Actinomadura spongiicola TaxID=2303421 RepID=A0A372GAD7_9ACTN|nr:cation:proton antiporter regulatory subunit [Actinomadura spongiicola]RFS82335.1 potassium transporter TrkA [Actinomadura spongiicola]
MDVERTALPGIGFQHIMTTGRGRRLGVISHRTGRRDLAIYDKVDPDTCLATVALTADEADTIAELLGTGRIIEHLAELHRQVEGLVTEQIPITPGSPYDGRPLGDTRSRTRTGASIVAVVRDGTVHASPRPDFIFTAGDIIVVVGTGEGTAAVAHILTHG